MIQLLILGLALLAGLWLLGQWFVSADPKKIAGFVKVALIVVIVAAAAILLITGRIGVALAALAFLFPLLLRLRNVYRGLKASFGPSPGATSDVRTEFLDMTLDHDTGDMDGRIRQGRFAGRTLSDLNQGELLDLLREMAGADPKGVPVLEAYLDRTIGSEWREDFAADQVPMSHREALDILGLEDGADEEAIKAAHRAKMKDHHPDRGGSDEEAMRINRAKDVLLGDG